ncbi:hypothetical protein AAVH_28666 [Aphelenchoides avenae]|nr:hypothetical protein AAVH_28666 [Aphelenchus avenae]
MKAPRTTHLLLSLFLVLAVSKAQFLDGFMHGLFLHHHHHDYYVPYQSMGYGGCCGYGYGGGFGYPLFGAYPFFGKKR